MDDEEGDGWGVGFGWRRWLESYGAGWNFGARVDYWRLDLDWSDEGPPVRSGNTDVGVLVPSLEGGYSWPIRRGGRFDFNVGLGYEAGTDLPDINGVKVGLSICFDIRFPEMFRQMARAGAQVILVPAAFTRTTGKAHWEVLVRARAIENQAYVVASATIASEDATASGFETWGHAMVAGPWGDVLADLGEVDYGVRVVELDLAKVDEVRAKLPVLHTGRPEVYQREPRHI